MKSFIVFLAAFILFIFSPLVEAQNVEYIGSTLWTRINDTKVSGNYAYCVFGNGLVILDISNPSSPVFLSQLFLQTGTYGIYIDEGVADHNPNFYRFTVAEELAHIQLHKSILDEVKDINLAVALRSWRGYEKIDRNAKRFAAAILMPSSHVVEDARKYYPKLVTAAGFGNKEAVIQYMISILCKKYIVSYEAMKYRLDEWPIRIIEKIISAMKEELDFLE